MQLIRKVAKTVLPNTVLRHIARYRRPQEARRFDDLRCRYVTDPMVLSLKPCLEQRAIFFHIPKTAGISVSQTLFGCRAGQHMLYHDYELAFSAKELRTFYKFAFVRNPWDRLVSAYHYMADGGMGALDAQQASDILAPYSGFDEFVRGYMRSNQHETKLHLRSQWQFICPSAQDDPAVDFVGRFETLQADFAAIARRLGKADNLAHTNKGGSRKGRSDYRSFYTDVTAEIVAKAYRRDIDLFGYDF